MSKHITAKILVIDTHAPGNDCPMKLWDKADIVIKNGAITKDRHGILDHFERKKEPPPATLAPEAFRNATHEGYRLEVRVDRVHTTSPELIDGAVVTTEWEAVKPKDEIEVKRSEDLQEHGLYSRDYCLACAHLLLAKAPWAGFQFRVVKYKLVKTETLNRLEEGETITTKY